MPPRTAAIASTGPLVAIVMSDPASVPMIFTSERIGPPMFPATRETIDRPSPNVNRSVPTPTRAEPTASTWRTRSSFSRTNRAADSAMPAIAFDAPTTAGATALPTASPSDTSEA